MQRVSQTNPHPSQKQTGQNADFAMEFNRKRSWFVPGTVPVCPEDRSCLKCLCLLAFFFFRPLRVPVCSPSPHHDPAHTVGLNSRSPPTPPHDHSSPFKHPYPQLRDPWEEPPFKKHLTPARGIKFVLSRKGFCRTLRGIFRPNFSVNFAGYFWVIFGAFFLGKTGGKIHPKIHSKIQIRVLGAFRPKSTLQESAIDVLRFK